MESDNEPLAFAFSGEHLIHTEVHMKNEASSRAFCLALVSTYVGAATGVTAASEVPTIPAGLWEVSTLHQSVGLQVGSETRPSFTTKSTRSMVCRAERHLGLDHLGRDVRSQSGIARDVVITADASVVTHIFLDKRAADEGGRVQSMMEIYRGGFTKEFTVTTIIDDSRSYLLTAADYPVPMFNRTLERFKRRGDCPPDMKPGDSRDLENP
jgi:hypothetical protein